MVLYADPRRLRVSAVAEEVANGCAELVRASLSIVSNIAEACGRGTVPDFRRLLLHARGSTQEVLAQLRLVKPTTEEDRRLVRSLQSRTVLVLKMLNRLYGHPPPDR